TPLTAAAAYPLLQGGWQRSFQQERHRHVFRRDTGRCNRLTICVMGVRLIGKSWWIDFRFDQTRYRKRSPQNSRAGALAYEATLRQKLARGESIDRVNATEQPTFEQFAWKWFDEYVIPNNKYSGQRLKIHIH